MKHSRPLLTALLTLSALPSTLLFAQSPVPIETSSLGKWLESRSASFMDWTADGALLISTRFGAADQLHRVRTALGSREQLTWQDEPIRRAVAHPHDANLLLFLKDRGGDENTQLWLHNLTDHSERLLTDGKSRNGLPHFAHDGKRIAFNTNARDGHSHDIYSLDVTSTAAPQLLITGGSETLRVQDWSLDDKRLAVIRQSSTTDSKLFMADTSTGQLTPFEPAADYKGSAITVSQARFSRDGRGIFFISDHGGEFSELHYADLYTGERRKLTPQSRWDVTHFDLSTDGRHVAYTLNEGGVDRLVLYDLKLQADVLLPPLPAGSLIDAIDFDRSSRKLAVTAVSPQSPRDVYVYALGDATTDSVAVPVLTRWTQSETGPINATQFVPAQPLQFATWDRVGNRPRMLSGFIYKPRTPGPYPVILDLHGPDSQHRPGWDAFTQYLVNDLGYAVIAPNLRGSAGYGRSFLKLDDGELRDDAARDIGSLLVWISLQPDLNRNKIVLRGDAYGRYIALASLATYSDRLAGAVIIAGKGTARPPNAAAITKPVLTVPGLNDPNAPATVAQFLRQLN
jgi:dipeptidyl aminopeptidase/acylaminoacyl peptidase